MELLPPRDDAWLELVASSPDATPFHHSSWGGAIADAYGFAGHVLAWQAPGGRLLGGVPVMRVGARMVALPFTDHCAPLTAPDTDAAGFCAELERSGLRIELRFASPVGNTEQAGTLHVLDLARGPEDILRRLHRTWRKRIAAAPSMGVEVAATTSRDELSAFYRLHSETRRRQGVPVQPRRFMEAIWRRVLAPGLGFVITARVDGLPVASALFLAWNRRLIYKYGASKPDYWRTGANFLVHWTAIEWACANGFAEYDLGRTDPDHHSLRRFKAGWGAHGQQLLYTHIGGSAPRSDKGPLGVALAEVIKHSPPLVCRALGELLYRYAA